MRKKIPRFRVEPGWVELLMLGLGGVSACVDVGGAAVVVDNVAFAGDGLIARLFQQLVEIVGNWPINDDSVRL